MCSDPFQLVWGFEVLILHLLVLYTDIIYSYTIIFFTKCDQQCCYKIPLLLIKPRKLQPILWDREISVQKLNVHTSMLYLRNASLRNSALDCVYVYIYHNRNSMAITMYTRAHKQFGRIKNYHTEHSIFQSSVRWSCVCMCVNMGSISTYTHYIYHEYLKLINAYIPI